MKVIWLTRMDPFEPDRGDLIYSAGLIQALAAQGVQIVVLTHPRKDALSKAPPNVECRCGSQSSRHRVWSLLSQLPSDAYRWRSDSLIRMLREELDRGGVDVVVVDFFAMAWALDYLIPAGRVVRSSKRPVLVYISHHYEGLVRPQVANNFKNPFFRGILQIDAKKVVRYEHRAVRICDLVTAITEADRLAFQKYAPEKTVIALTPGYDGETLMTRAVDQSLPRRVVIAGALDWIAKQDTIRSFLKWAEMPFRAAGIELLVVGRAPDALIEELKVQYPSCTFTGRVDDIRPYLSSARIGVMPDDIGGGFKLKYLHYVFAGLPIATIRSQFVGLPLDVDRDVIARDNMKDLVQAIVQSIDDTERLDGMRQRALEACAGAFNWNDRGRQLYESINTILESL